ncbi:MAG: caspase, EACC1-associated type [Elainellaceae cyanobacterium]
MSGQRVALLVGVSEYGEGYDALPGTVTDLERMQHVLKNPDMGGFDVETLLNPNPQPLREAIERFFGGRKKEDVLLFYFSGHGSLDNATSSQLYLSTHQTRKESKRLVESSAVEAALLHRHLVHSKSQKKIVILDCCFSGAVANLLSKGDDPVNLQQLEAQGTVLLASCNAFEVSYQTKGAAAEVDIAQSLYTRYLVEGIETGAARQGKHEWIFTQDLHEYAKRRFQTELAAATEPQIIVFEKEGYRIPIARAPKGDPKVEYRQIVAEVLKENDGEINNLNRVRLDIEREALELSLEDAQQIIVEQQKPYEIRRQKRARYAEAFKAALTQGYPLTKNSRRTLKLIQLRLSLRDEDISSIEHQLAQNIKSASTKVQTAPKPTPPPTPDTSKVPGTINPLSARTVAPTPATQATRHIPQTRSQRRSSEQPGNPSPTSLSRRQVLILLGFGGVGLLGTIGISQLSNENLPSLAVDYSKLEEFLQAQNWKEADQETLNVMLKVANREEEGWLDSESLENFPCDTLQRIDQLWVNASDGKFGFSVQKQIWQDVGSPTVYNDAWEEFGDRVGWRVNGRWIDYPDNVTFDTSAPGGHLPMDLFLGCGSGGVRSGAGGPWLSSLASRFVKCKL